MMDDQKANENSNEAPPKQEEQEEQKDHEESGSMDDLAERIINDDLRRLTTHKRLVDRESSPLPTDGIFLSLLYFIFFFVVCVSIVSIFFVMFLLFFCFKKITKTLNLKQK